MVHTGSGKIYTEQCKGKTGFERAQGKERAATEQGWENGAQEGAGLAVAVHTVSYPPTYVQSDSLNQAHSDLSQLIRLCRSKIGQLPRLGLTLGKG